MSYDRIAAEQLAYELDRQHGVAGYAQLISGGWTWPRIRTAVRRRELRQIHPRVYVGHTGPLTPLQRAWAAVLYADPAALCLSSATTPASEGDIHVAVERGRRLAGTPGVVIHQVTDLSRQIRAFSFPPRLSHEHNLLMRVRLAQDEEAMVGLLTDTVGRRGVTADSVRRAIELHPRQPHKRLVLALLSDIETGIESVLEQGYLKRVERAHGLPAPVRQLSRPNGERRDGEYPDWGVVIELDGRLNHDSWSAGNRDAGRDLTDQAAGRTVVRLRWRQVMVESCRTAAGVGAILQRHGWTGSIHRCGPTCLIGLGSATVTR